MTVADLIAKLQGFDADKQVKLDLTVDYRDKCYDIADGDVYFDDCEDAVVIDGTTLSMW